MTSAALILIMVFVMLFMMVPVFYLMGAAQGGEELFAPTGLEKIFKN